jgi:hypothetical protein
MKTLSNKNGFSEKEKEKKYGEIWNLSTGGLGE